MRRRLLALVVAMAGAPATGRAVLPDLTVTSLSATPTSLGAGGTLTIADTVKAVNAATSGFYVKYYLSSDQVAGGDVEIGSRWVASLANGASSSASTKVTLPVSLTGTYWVVAVADATKLVAESNEANNSRVGSSVTISKPDLKVTAVSVSPASVEAGGTVTVAGTVAATGGAAAGFYVTFYLSADAVAGGDTEIGSVWVPGLAAGASASASKTATLPAGLTGTYWLVAVADSTKLVAESNEANNSFVSNTVTISKPDLKVTALSVSPATVNAGGTVTVTGTVAATGGATPGFYVTFYLSADAVAGGDTEIGSLWVPGLAAGASYSASKDVTLPAELTGTYWLVAVADSTNLVAESNETNNSFVSNPVTISKPDLTMASVSVSPASVAAGGTVTVTDTVTASGGAAPGFYVKFYLSSDQVAGGDVEIGSRWVTGLAAGASSSASTVLTLPPSLAGTYWVVAAADATGVVAESNEANNALVGNALTVGVPDLTVVSVSATPASLHPGEALTVTDTVQSTGGSAGPFVVRYYLSTDQTITPSGDTYIGERFVPGLAAGGTSTATTSWTLPVYLTGPFYVGAIVDANGAVAESNESNNTAVGNQIQIALPDVAMTSVSAAPAVLEPGGTLTVTDTVTAPTWATAGFVVRYYLSADQTITASGDTYIGERYVPGLAAGGTSTATTTWTLPVYLNGTLYIGAIADAMGFVAESDETNNTAAGNQIQIGLPDIAMTSVSALPASLQPGGTLTVTDTVTAPLGATSAFYVRYYLSADQTITGTDFVLGDRYVAGLAAGGTSTATTTWTVPVSVTGSYYIGAVADFRGEVAESNETNNTAVGNQIQIALPDIAMTSVSATPAYLDPGGTLTVTDTVTAPTYATSGFYVRYYLSADQAITPTDRDVGERYVAGLPGGGTSTATTSFTLPADLVGQFYVGAIADFRGDVAESNESNNTAVGNRVQVGGDRTPPDIVVTGVSDGDVTNATPLTVCWHASDPNLASASATLDGAPVGTCTAVYLEGDHELLVQASDSWGNSAEKRVRFTLDFTPPQIQLAGVSDGLVTRQDVTPTFGGTDLHLAGVAATLDLLPFQSGSAVTAEGEHDLAITASDAAGNSRTVAVHFAIDRTPPTIDVRGVSEGLLSNSPPLAPIFEVRDAHPGTASATLDGAPFQSGGLVAAEGDHVLAVTASDAAGNPATATVHFAIDVTRPTLAVQSPADGAVTRASSVEVVVSASDDRSLAAVTAASMPLVRGADGLYRGTVSLAEGLNPVEVAAVDGAGNRETRLVTVRRDTVPPVIVLTSPPEGARIPATAVTVSGQVTDSSPVTVTVKGTGAAVAPDGTFSASVVIALGDNPIEVVATDAAGNRATASRLVVGVDPGSSTTPPSLLVAEPSPGFSITAPSVRVAGTVRASYAGGTVAVTVNGAPAPVKADGTFETTVEAPLGAVRLAVVATDDGGRTSQQVIEGWRAQGQSLALTVLSPSNGQIFGGGAVPVSGQVQGGIEPVKVTVNGTAVAVASGYFSGSVSLAHGDHVISIQASDAAGATGSATRQVTVDLVKPYLAVTRPAASSAEVSESPYRIEGTVGDEHLAGVTVNGVPASVLAGQFAASVPLVAGDNDVLVEARDVAGNLSQASVRLSVRALPPQVTILAPADGSELPDPVAHVRARVDATAAVQSVSVGAAAATQSGVEWVADVTLALGENAITVSASDANGMTGTSTVRVRYRDVTQEPLKVTGVSPAPGTTGVESDALVSLSFNKAVDPSSLEGRLTLSADGTALPGGFYVAPGGQTVSLVARQALPAGKRLLVRASGLAAAAGPGMDADFTSDFTTGAALRRLHGVVVDEQLQALSGVRVAIEGKGLETRTGDDGNWTLFDVPEGTVTLGFQGGRTSAGEQMGYARRRLFVDGSKDTEDDLLMVFPEDGATAQRFDAGGPVHLVFGDRHPGMTLDVEPGGAFLPDGRTAGLLTATQLPVLASPVPVENRGALAGLWQVGPTGLRLTRPVTMSLPNVSKEPAGRLAVIVTYDPVRHLLERSAIGRVSADAKVVQGLLPVRAAALDLFGYLSLSDEQHAALDQALQGGVVQPPASSPPDGGMGFLLGPSNPALRALLRLIALPLGDQAAYAQTTSQFDLCQDPKDTTNCYSPFGLLDGQPGPTGALYAHGRVRTSYLAATDQEPITYFKGWMVEAFSGVGRAKGVSGDYGQFSIPLRMPRWGDAWVRTLVDAGTRFRVEKEDLPDGGQRVRYLPMDSKWPIAANAYNMVTIPALNRSDLVVDLRVLTGKLRFVNRRGEPLGGACDPSATTQRSGNGDLLSVSPDDVALTEVHFFRLDDEKAPIARYTVAVPGTQPGACLGTHASYNRLRLGPSDPTQRRTLEWCPYYEAHRSTLSGSELIAYQTNCARPRETRVRLQAGDELRVVAVNHATGHTGMARVVVPPITSGNTCADKDKILFTDPWASWTPFSICPNAVQSIVITADVDLFPPEVDLRVARRVQDEGARDEGSRKTHLVRHGGAATTRDELMLVSTHWRVRLAPEPATPPPAPAPDGGAPSTDGGPGPKVDPYGSPGALDQPGNELEVLCSELPRNASAERKQRCKQTEKLLDEIPEGVSPLAAQVVKVTGTAVEQPAVSVFRVPPGSWTGTLQTGNRTPAAGGGPAAPPLDRANYYVHVVGHPLLFNDQNQNGTIELEELEGIRPAPPAFTNYRPGDPVGLPARALGLKDVYYSAEPDGTLIQRFDRAREHEFRVVEVARQQIVAQQGDGNTRRLDRPPPGREPAATQSDLGYQFLLSLLEPADPGRAGTLSGTYQVRLGSDSYGLDCAVKVDRAVGALTADCGGEFLYDVLTSRDILYFEVFLSGNSENVLYRYAFHGLTPRFDVVTAGRRRTASDAVTPDLNGEPATLRPISKPAMAVFFVGPNNLKLGMASLCLDATCSGDRSLLKKVALAWQDDGSYLVADLGGRLSTPLAQGTSTGLSGERRFELAMPNELAEMPGANSVARPVHLLLAAQDGGVTRPPVHVALGRPIGAFAAGHARAPGQQTLAGVNLNDGHLSFRHEDFALPEYASTVRFGRTYNNQDNEPGAVGTGWRHDYEGYVLEESLGRYTMVLGGQSYDFGKCLTLDAARRTAEGCLTDKSHGGILTVRRRADGSPDVRYEASNGWRYQFDRLSVRSGEKMAPATPGEPEDAMPGRRRWVLTAFEDGHARSDTDTKSAGWTQVEYLDRSDLVSKVSRQGGKLGIEFAYLPVTDAASLKLRALARRENFALLSTVTVKAGGTIVHQVGLTQDPVNGNLLGANRATGSPAQGYRYTYWQRAGLTGEDAWAAGNELQKAEYLLNGLVQRYAAYGRSEAWAGLPHGKAFEVVDGVTLPGYGGTPFAVQYSDAKRIVTRPDGVLASLDVNGYGNVTGLNLPITQGSFGWGSSQDGGPVYNDVQAVAGRSIKYDQDPQQRLRTGMVTLQAAPVGSQAVAGLGTSGPLASMTLDGRFGRPTATARPASSGTATWTTGVSPRGDPLGVVVGDNQLGTVLSLTREVDADGVVNTERDGVGRTTSYGGSNAFGLRTSASVAGPDNGGCGSYTRTLGYDAYGRLTSVSDTTGRSESWTYDAVGRMTRHTVAGTPAEDWSYAYADGENALRVTETLAGTDHRRVSSYQDGLLVSETVAYGQGKTATRSYGYEKGRLTSSRLSQDERTVTWSYGFDSQGRVTSVTATGDGGGRTTSYVLDGEGKVTSTTDPNQLVTRTGYDALGRAVSWEYEPTDVESVKRDPSGAVTRRKFGVSGQQHDVQSGTDALGATRSETGQGVGTEIGYDQAGRVTSRKDNETGLEETYLYDVLDRVTHYRRTVQSRGGALVLEETRQLGCTWTASVTQVIGTGSDPATRTEQKTITTDVRGRVLSRTETVGGQQGTWTYQYDPRGNVRAETSPTATVQREYDPLGRLVKVTDEATKVTSYTLDSTGLVMARSGPHPEAAWSFKYDAVGQLLEKKLGSGQGAPAWQYQYLTEGPGSAQETDPLGQVTVRFYNAAYKLKREERRGASETFTTSYAYDGPWVKSKTSTEGSWQLALSYSYDDRGRTLTSSESWTASAQSYDYSRSTPWSGRGTSLSETWSSGGKTESRSGSLTEDSLGNLVERVLGVTDRWTYDALGLVAKEELAGRPVRTWGYSGPVPLTEQYGTETTSYAYYPDGRIQSVTEPSGRTRSLTWDPRGLLASDTYGSDAWSYGYDGGGFLKTATHGTSTWSYDHGPRGELRSVIQPEGGTFSYGRDGLAQLSGITPPAGGMPGQTFGYDHLGREISRTRGGATWTTSWSSGEGTTSLPNGDTVARLLDGRGRVARKTLTAGAGSVAGLTEVTYAYNGLDLLMKAVETGSEGGWSAEYGHDARGLTTSVKRTDAPDVGYAYRDSGEVLSVTGALSLSYGYDGQERLSSITGPSGTTTVEWEPGGARLTKLAGGGVTERRCYDGAGRVVEVVNATGAWSCGSTVDTSVLSGFRYGYDGRGNRLVETYFTGTGGYEETRYGYDGSDRLVGVQYPERAVLYQLSGDGTRLGEKVVALASSLGPSGYDGEGSPLEHRTYGYDGRGGLTSLTDELGHVPVATWEVDAAGRVKGETRSGVTRSYGWDADGRLKTATVTVPIPQPSPSPPQVQTTTVSYRYDHAGRRVRSDGPGGVTTYLWGDGELLVETPPSGPAVRYERRAELVAAAGGERLLHDGLGSVVGRAGAVYRYDAWGNFTSGAPGTGQPSLAYAGQHWDGDLGLSYAQQRWYDPRVGRFLSEDPVFGDLLRPNGLHAFGYANANPLTETDPEGTQSYGSSLTFLRRPSFSVPSASEQCERESYVVGCMMAIQARFDDEFPTFDQYIGEGKCTPQFVKGFSACDGRPVGQAIRNSDIAKNTREFWTASPERASAMGCFLGGGNAVVPAGDVSSLLPELQQAAAACQFGVGAATLVMTGGELGVRGWRALENIRPPPAPGLAGMTTEGRTVAVAGEGEQLARAGVTVEGRVAAAGERVPNRMAMSAPERAGAAPRLEPGKSPLKEFDIDAYGTFSKRPNDALSGHEMLQNKWLEVKGLSKGRLVDDASRQNPAVALSDVLHKRVNKAQIRLGLHDASYLRTLEAEQVIQLNARAMRDAGIPEYVIQTLQKEAVEYASGLPRAP